MPGEVEVEVEVDPDVWVSPTLVGVAVRLAVAGSDVDPGSPDVADGAGRPATLGGLVELQAAESSSAAMATRQPMRTR